MPLIPNFSITSSWNIIGKSARDVRLLNFPVKHANTALTYPGPIWCPSRRGRQGFVDVELKYRGTGHSLVHVRRVSPVILIFFSGNSGIVAANGSHATLEDVEYMRQQALAEDIQPWNYTILRLRLPGPPPRLFSKRRSRRKSNAGSILHPGPLTRLVEMVLLVSIPNIHRLRRLQPP